MTRAQAWSDKFATMSHLELLDLIAKERREGLRKKWGIEYLNYSIYADKIIFIEFEFDDETLLAWKGDFPDHYKIDHNGFYLGSRDPNPTNYPMWTDFGM
jgi:hypothetical protein